MDEPSLVADGRVRIYRMVFDNAYGLYDIGGIAMLHAGRVLYRVVDNSGPRCRIGRRTPGNYVTRAVFDRVVYVPFTPAPVVGRRGLWQLSDRVMYCLSGYKRRLIMGGKTRRPEYFMMYFDTGREILGNLLRCAFFRVGCGIVCTAHGPLS